MISSNAGIYALENLGHTFESRNGPVDANGTMWDPVTGESSDGRQLRRVPGHRLFAFAWQDAHGADTFYQ